MSTNTAPTSTPGTNGAGPMLELDDVHVFYGNIAAVQGLSLTVNDGEIVTLIGSNGAGKSTTLRTISGLLRPKQGRITFLGRQLNGVEGHDVVARGITHSPEGRRIFPRLAERLSQKAGTMSGGEQQMLAVGRALMGRPKLLLLDEPSMGLAPVLVDLIFDTIATIRQQGTTILLVEQNALAALRIADRAYVLESGSLKLQGSAAELARDSEVVNAYLGG